MGEHGNDPPASPATEAADGGADPAANAEELAATPRRRWRWRRKRAATQGGSVIKPRRMRWGRWRQRRREARAARRNDPTPRRRWPRWLLGGLALVSVLAVAAVLLAPGYVATRIEDALHERWGASASLDHVEIRWGDLGIDVYGVHLADDVRLEVDVVCVEIDVGWSALWDGAVRPTVVVHEPAIVLEAKPAPPREAPRQGPPRFDTIEIMDGTLEVRASMEQGPIGVTLHDVSAQIRNRQDLSASAKMDLAISAAARIGEEGELHVDGRASSRAPDEAWSVRFDLQRFELATLNNLWLSVVEMDVDRGFLALDGELTRTPTRLRGRVRPQFQDVALLGADEDALHPMAEALFGHMLMGARSTISIDRPLTGERSSLPELLKTDWQTLIQRAIQQGYARRLSTLKGFTASIGDVKVDFSQGLLQLFDVTIDAEAPVIEVPLVTIGQIDVVFDPSVTEAGAPAYKHITLVRPTFTFATGVEGSENLLQFDESWLDTISAIPFATRDLAVHEGRIDLWDLRHDEPVHIFVEDIDLRGEEMARDLHAAGVRGAQLHGTATVLGEAPASIHMVYEPEAPVPNLDLDMRLEALDLTTLAPTLQTFAEVDAVGGHVGFSAHLSARDYWVEATVIPDVYRPQLRGMGGRMLRKIILGRALRRMQSHMFSFRYSMKPGEGLLNEFFPQLIQAVFLGR